jgi:mRNA turnover protein 4
MAKGIGTTEEEEYVPNASKIANKLQGDVGIFFTNQEYGAVQEYFSLLSEKDYARSGGKSTETVVIPEGALMRHGMNFPNNMEPLLRKLGLPTELRKGVVWCREEYTICKEGAELSPDQAHLLVWFCLM